MDILPAIDLKDGKAVRLTKGLMDSAKIYSDEPVEIARYFEDIGSKWLHLVDLNGAFKGNPANLAQVQKIVKNTHLKVELGGGIRDEDTIKMYLDMGIERVILGSIALKNPDFVKKMAQKYPIVVGIDAIDGYVAVEGWAKVSQIKATKLAMEFSKAGVKGIICTDINKDGMLSGVNLEFTLSIKKASNLPTIASGGVKDLQDIIKCKEADIDGVIVGKAFYEKKLDLKEAFKVLE